jgi:hypothetical protein
MISFGSDVSQTSETEPRLTERDTLLNQTQSAAGIAGVHIGALRPSFLQQFWALFRARCLLKLREPKCE